jgi:ribosomal protein S18 acetylase RimI-like enzyme
LQLVFGPLSAQHDRGDFASGSAALDNYLKRVASQDDRRNLARVFVATEPGAARIAGFYSLSGFSVGLGVLPNDLSAKLPAYPEIPAALIGRLARHVAYRGQNVGEMLLMDALRRIALAGQALAVHVIVVDAKDDRARAFYRAYGFAELAAHPRRLVIPVATVAKVLRL